ncbi:metal dependent phosphohydrolase [Desulfovibrio sp. X2]|uniref:HD domain-containing protein n=1 Tax=Desulfovibrio sp. X2 TaxID=941449 RepID=UPI000358AEEB|nr:HD domain-containing protein [Desulfovibrio sp. X2]EPR37635.1 metal dependent phosphohydrolase [Desulfovibrio sp. X2]
MLDRDAALALVRANIPDLSLFQHCLASEAVLRSLADRLGQDETLWALTGLLHDLDYATTKDDPARHGLAAADMLAAELPGEALQAIRAHNAEHTGVAPESALDFALRCGETVTGLITAAALVRPTKLEGLAASSLKKKMKDKAFARTVNRETIKECDRLGLELADFLNLAVAAMQGVAPDVGLA